MFIKRIDHLRFSYLQISTNSLQICRKGYLNFYQASSSPKCLITVQWISTSSLQKQQMKSEQGLESTVSPYLTEGHCQRGSRWWLWFGKLADQEKKGGNQAKVQGPIKPAFKWFNFVRKRSYPYGDQEAQWSGDSWLTNIPCLELSRYPRWQRCCKWRWFRNSLVELLLAAQKTVQY